MDSTRRNFLKVAGAAAVGLAAGPAKADATFEFIFGPNGAAPFDGVTAGKKWAMVVDTRKCTDTLREKMIEACNHAHNVPHSENHRHEIKWIWNEGFDHAFPGQMNEHLPPEVTRNEVVVMCNHCENPPCVRVCPTKATFKRDDGIVLMDYHRCIGCRFCMAACPYGSRSFNYVVPFKDRSLIVSKFPTRMKGVVEKCNFCAEKIAKGEMPACVDACENNELIFGDLGDPESKVSQILRMHYTIRRKPEIGTQPQVYYIV